MSSNDEESTLQELVIIRRRAGDDEAGHHGGVWKIAYADFMTAMMAFFLVMWLINATDKKVLTQVATYFNPVRLTDKAPTPRGLQDSDSGAPGKENEPGQSKAKEGKAKASKIGPAQRNLEEALFKDPYGTLERLAEQAAAADEPKPQPSAGGVRAQAEGSLVSGEAFRDPFQPELPRSPQPDVAGGPKAQTPEAERIATGEKAEGAARDKVAVQDRDTPRVPAAPEQAADAEKAKPEDTQKAEAERAERSEVAKLEAEIKQALGPLAPGATPDIEVKVTEDGLLISLTDKFDFGMFAIASAEPRPATIAIMDKLAKVLQGRPGQLIVRGHTDGRPFRSATYDNWRLSSARAHMAYYMLVRGGIEEKRFQRIEGHADRSLRIAGDAEAAQNRRIEILLRKPTP